MLLSWASEERIRKLCGFWILDYSIRNTRGIRLWKHPVYDVLNTILSREGWHMEEISLFSNRSHKIIPTSSQAFLGPCHLFTVRKSTLPALWCWTLLPASYLLHCPVPPGLQAKCTTLPSCLFSSLFLCTRDLSHNICCLWIHNTGWLLATLKDFETKFWETLGES